MTGRRGLLDTSVLIAAGTGRLLDHARIPDDTAVCVVTLAELQLGVLAAADTHTRTRRLATLESVSGVEVLPVTVDAARQWASLRLRLAEAGLRANVNDLWIAAVAAAHDLDVVTQDDDFGAIEQVGGPAVVHV